MGLMRIKPKAWVEVKIIINVLPVHERLSLQMTYLLDKIIKRRNLMIKAIAFRQRWGAVDSQK